MPDYRLVYSDELMHYGVKGMKWGKRKARPEKVISDTRRNYDTAKAEYKAAKRQANKSFNKAYNNAIGAYSPFKKHRQANDARWEQADRDIGKSVKAQERYKKAKKVRKQQIKSTYKDMESKASIRDKVLYNSSTRKKAAKYVVDNNMSYKEATKKANADARRNSALILAAYGAVTVGSLYMQTRR